jgi:hypothetical protein
MMQTITEQNINSKIAKGSVIISTDEGMCIYEKERESGNGLRYSDDELIELYILEELILVTFSPVDENGERVAIYTKKFETFKHLKNFMGSWEVSGVNGQAIMDKIKNQMESIIESMARKGLIHIYNKCHI